MGKFLRVKVQGIILIGIILFLISCGGGSNWSKSPGRADYDKAKDYFKNKRNLEGLVYLANSVALDTSQFKSKKLLYQKYDKIMPGILKELASNENTRDISKAKRRYELFVHLNDLHTMLSDIEFPLKHPKGKWSWTPEIIDYSQNIIDAREYTYQLIYDYAIVSLNNNNPKQAYNYFNDALGFTLKGVKRDERREIGFQHLMDYGKNLKDSDNVKEVEYAYYGFYYAAKYHPEGEATQLRDAARLRVSELYVVLGKDYEEKDNLEDLLLANDQYTFAIEWNKSNTEAKELKETIKPKISEKYYAKAEGMHKSKSREYQKILDLYTSAGYWVPGYKKSTTRIYGYQILSNLDELNENIAKTNEEQAKFQQKLNTVQNGVNVTKKKMDDVTYLTGKMREYNDAIKDMSNMLRVLSPLPIIGTVASVSNATIATVKPPIAKGVQLANVYEAPVVIPLKTITENVKKGVDATHNKISETSIHMKQTQGMVRNLRNCIFTMDNEADYKACAQSMKNINATLPQLNAKMASMNTTLDEITKINTSIRGYIESPINTVKSSFDRIKTPFNTLSSGVHNANKVLKKSVHIPWPIDKDLSVHKVLKEAGKTLSFVTDPINKMFASAFREMGVQLPTIQGIEELQAALAKVKGQFGSYKSKANDLDNTLTQYSNFQKTYKQEVQVISDLTGCSLAQN